MSEVEFTEEEGFRESKPGVEGETKKKRSCVLPFFLFLGGVGVLAAILVPNFVRARSRGQLTACKSNLKNIGTALEMYSTDWDGKYPQDMALLTPEYLKSIPTCPSAGSMTYTYDTGAVGYNAEITPQPYKEYYLICCGGPNHEAVGVPQNYPQYDGLRGLYER